MKTILFGSIFLISIVCHALDRNAEGLTPLHIAAGAGDVQRIADLLKQGADIYALDSKMGISVLHKAVYSGKSEAVELLLKNGALVNLQSPSNGDTPLHDSIYFRRGKDSNLIKTLLKFKPSLSIRNRAGLTPIESAKLLKAIDIAEILEKYESQRQSQASKNIMEAVRNDQVPKLKVLLQKNSKAILSESDDQGFTPLLWASREGRTDMVRLLLKSGGNPNQLDQWMGANAGHKAAFWGRADTVKTLIEGGLDLNAQGGYNGYTPLHDAVSGNHFEVAEILVKAGAKTDIKGHDGLTAVDIAKANNNQKILSLIQKAN